MALSKTLWNKWTPTLFVGAFAFSFFFILVAADTIGFVPYYIDGTDPHAPAIAYAVGSIQAEAVALNSLPVLGETAAPRVPASSPKRIIAKSIGLDLPVGNPTTTDVDALDNLLSSEVVRYPGSGLLGQNGNVLIFGHSSHLPVVYNHFYQAFNGLPDLKTGAVITLVGSNGMSYNYSVTSIKHVDATDTSIDLSGNGGAKLTLSTCDTFSAKTARWVVEADFIGTSN